MKKFIYYFILVLVFVVFGFIMYQLGKGSLSFDFPNGNNNNNNNTEVRDLETISCTSDEDCVPVEGCHPMECINKDYKTESDGMYMCTQEFKCNAAYHDSDCLCKKGVCVNDRLENPSPSC